jgi:predicted regulator of Ras-like GTPase activity (Roadblock/LC7/MglB family)
VVNSTVLARAAEVQSNDVMFKPFAADELVRRIEMLLGTPANGAPAPAPSAAPRPVAPPPPVPRAAEFDTASAGEGDLTSRLAALAGAPGVRFVALADREGFLIECAGSEVPEVEVAGALAACLNESSEGIGRELAQGVLQGMILEYEHGTLLLYGVGRTALLAVLVSDASALGKVRYFVKKSLPGILQEV